MVCPIIGNFLLCLMARHQGSFFVKKRIFTCAKDYLGKNPQKLPYSKGKTS
jgi:hypothetical protein